MTEISVHTHKLTESNLKMTTEKAKIHLNFEDPPHGQQEVYPFPSFSALNPVQMEDGKSTILTIRNVQAMQQLHLAWVGFPEHHACISGGDSPHKEAGAVPGADLKGT